MATAVVGTAFVAGAEERERARSARWLKMPHSSQILGSERTEKQRAVDRQLLWPVRGQGCMYSSELPKWSVLQS